MTRFVLATHNQHKVDEFRAILSSRIHDIEVVSYDGPEPLEDGSTFAENALIKARAAATHTGLPALADDSGLAVDALGGAPGVLSARWAGEPKSDTRNLEKLLDELREVPEGERGASFVCCIALVEPGNAGGGDSAGREFTVEARWSGTITFEARGENGFGYDPIFVPDGLSVTSAQMLPAEKNAQSHRARALKLLAEALTQ